MLKIKISMILQCKTMNNVFYVRQGLFGNSDIRICSEITMEEDATGRYSSYDRNILIRESQQTFILVKTS